MTFVLPELPYKKNALAPYLSEETLEYHYGKHHQAYVTNLNNLTADSDLKKKSLEELIRTQAPGPIFNNASQVWNHTFYWNSMTPHGGGEPKGALADAINASFGSYAQFKEQFTKTAVSHFASGWAWLCKDKNGKLIVESTANAGCPLKEGLTPLLTCDVWEHAYYIDYRNLRPKFVEGFFTMVNWDFASKNFG
jgi:Fe-Mn family superoxide dismutase